MKMFGMCPPHHHSGHLHFRLHLASHRSCSLLSHIYPFILRQNLAANSICDFGHLVDAAQCPHPFLSLHIPEFPPLATYTPHSWRCFPWFRPTPALSDFLPTLLRSQHGAVSPGTAGLFSPRSLHCMPALPYTSSLPHSRSNIPTWYIWLCRCSPQAMETHCCQWSGIPILIPFLEL